MCAIKIDGKIVSSKTKKNIEATKKVVSDIGKEVWWINGENLDLYNGIITKEFDITVEVNGFCRNKYKNPNKDYSTYIVDKLKINYE